MGSAPVASSEPLVKYAISYIRFSSKKQREGDSERRQLEDTIKYCEREGLTLIPDLGFQDLGVSAFTGANLKAKKGHKPGLMRLMEYCSDGPDGTPRIIPRGYHIVVEAFDRISRQDVWKSMTLLAQIRDSGVVLHLRMTNIVVYPKDMPGPFNINNNDDFTFVRVAVEALQAHAFSKKQSERLLKTFAAKRERARNGEALISKSLPWWLKLKKIGKDEYKIVPIPERSRIVRKIFKWTANGWSSVKIAYQLTNDKVPTWRKNAKKWFHSRVRDLIRSDAAFGVLNPTAKTRKEKEYSPGLNYTIEGYYPAIVTREMALKARTAMRDRVVMPKEKDFPPNRPQNLLRELLRHKGQSCRFQSRPNGARGPDGKKTWNGYYDDCDSSTPGHETWSMAARQLEPVIIAGLLELKAEDLVPLTIAKAKRSLLLRKEITELERQIGNVTLGIKKLGASDALIKELRELEVSIAEKRRELTGAEAQESAGNITHMKGFLKALSPDLKDVVTRDRTATALYRLVKRIDVADEIADLPVKDIADDVEKLNAQLIPQFVEDPYPIESKRRRLFSLLITFRGGGQRLIIRTSTPYLISARYQPNPLRTPEVVDRFAKEDEEWEKLPKREQKKRLAEIKKNRERLRP